MKTKKLDSNQLRQGDVLLVRASAIPANAERLDTNGGNVVLAYGESTGHKHQFMFQDADMFRGGGGQFVEVLREGAKLLHEEHSAVPFAKGIYKRCTQVEYAPQALRTVAD